MSSSDSPFAQSVHADCVIYDGESIDGVCAAWVVKKYHELNNLPVPTFYGKDIIKCWNMYYVHQDGVNKDIETFKDKNIMFINISLSFYYLFKIYKSIKTIQLFDCHIMSNHTSIPCGMFSIKNYRETENYINYERCEKIIKDNPEVYSSGKYYTDYSENAISGCFPNIRLIMGNYNHPETVYKNLFKSEDYPWFIQYFKEYSSDEIKTGIKRHGVNFNSLDEFYQMSDYDIEIFKNNVIKKSDKYEEYKQNFCRTEYKCKFNGYNIKLYDYNNYIRGFEDFGPGKKPMYLPFWKPFNKDDKTETYPDFTVGWIHNVINNTYNLVVESDNKVDVDVFCSQFEQRVGHKNEMFCITPPNISLAELFEFES